MALSIGETTIRSAGPADAAAVAGLYGELGYDTPVERVRDWMDDAIGRGRDALLVAEAEGAVIGCLQVTEVRRMAEGAYGEVVSLVVTEAARSRGVGAALMARAEAWASERGFRRMRVRTNAARVRAHRFYERLGYGLKKTQKVYDRDIGPA